MQQNVDILTRPLTECINYAFSKSKFPYNLETGKVISSFKKGNNIDKMNYRPIGILSSLCKVFERVMFSRLTNYINPALNQLLCGFRTKHSTQHALLNLLKTWQNSLDKGGMVGTILVDLSKAFDSLPHDVIIAKLAAYGLSIKSLKLIFSYLNNRE